MGLSCLLSPMRAQEPDSPSSAEAPYCDLPCCPPAPQNPLGTTTCAGHSVEGLDLRPGPQRWVKPQAPGTGSLGGRMPIPSLHATLHGDSVPPQQLPWVTWSAHKEGREDSGRESISGVFGKPWKAHIDLSLFYLSL